MNMRDQRFGNWQQDKGNMMNTLQEIPTGTTKTMSAFCTLVLGLLFLAAGTLTAHAQLLYPATAGPSANHLYVASYNSSRIQKFTPSGVRTQFDNTVPTPSGIAFDSAANLFVMSITANKIYKITPSGVVSVFASSLAAGNYPSGLAFDSAGNLYSTNYVGGVIQKFTPGGVGSVFATGGLLGGPTGLAFDGAGNLYVSCINGTIVKFTPGGVGSIFANTLLSHPMGLAFDSAGNLFVANLNNSRIIKFTPAGVGSIFASTGSIRPYGLAFDSAGDLFTGGSNPWGTPGGWDYAVMKFTPAGVGSIFNAGGIANGLEDCKGLAFGPANAASLNAPPTANAGADFSVDEGQSGVPLDGSLSNDPDGDALTYAWAQLPGGTAVTLSDATAQQPTFDAPTVALGGETLSFELTVTANGETATDTVSVTVVNVNHPPVADAGDDQSIAEGSPVTLHGENTFDPDNDETQPTFTYAWVQLDNGGPTVTLAGADTKNPSFTAPYVGSGGAPGIVATLVFELRVNDGFSVDDVVDAMAVYVTNVNNLPTAEAGAGQTVNENAAVALNAAGSSDPDSDTLTYAWAEVGGSTVVLNNATTATPSFTAPFVGAGGTDLTFEVTVDDGYGGTSTDTVVVHVQNINDPPLASAARPTIATLWPPNHQMVAVGITGVTDPNNNATITITGVTQDEPTNGQGDGDTAIDAVINADGTVLLRAERSGTGDGRVYRIAFTASDLEGSTSGVVFVTVPHSKKNPAIDSGGIFDSTQ